MWFCWLLELEGFFAGKWELEGSCCKIWRFVALSCTLEARKRCVQIVSPAPSISAFERARCSLEGSATLFSERATSRPGSGCRYWLSEERCCSGCERSCCSGCEHECWRGTGRGPVDVLAVGSWGWERVELGSGFESELAFLRFSLEVSVVLTLWWFELVSISSLHQVEDGLVTDRDIIEVGLEVLVGKVDFGKENPVNE